MSCDVYERKKAYLDVAEVDERGSKYRDKRFKDDRELLKFLMERERAMESRQQSSR